ncbi:DUF1345 domain-containing protein [Pimelobacter simplex]|uniref:DUF1345 domain-containing protein n=1 Tax=Nocardioides simplex TaxID=2045 RepID=UPI003AAC4431
MARPRRLDPDSVSALGWGVQLLLSLLGVAALFDESLTLLWIWCGVGTAYVALAVVSLALYARRDPAAPVPAEELHHPHGLRGVLTFVLTVVPVVIGVVAAMIIVGFRDDRYVGSFVRLPGVWAMLLAWVLLHWGFAQLYAARSQEARPGRVLDFPGTPHPTLVDHVYFAFTIGTTFAASDVDVLSTRTRWLVTVHSVLSFFLNALIIVLAFNTITNG